MTRLLNNVARIILFIVITCLVILAVQKVINAKWMYDSSEPHTETYKGFYKMEKNSIDAIIIGTSHAASGFNPQDFYNASQIRTYNLSSSGQPVFLSYYWVAEALKYQAPSVVIFDVNYLFNKAEADAYYRKALDNMRWGKEKYSAIKVIEKIDSKQTIISYFLPFFRYHDRWKEINEYDFLETNFRN